MTFEKKAYRIAELCQAYGLGRTKLYEEIAQGRLRAFKVGRVTLVSLEAADKWRKLCEEGKTSNRRQKAADQ